MKTELGATVHYVQGGVHYAAMVVHVSTDNELVNLVVFPNYVDDLVVGSKTHAKPALAVPYAHSVERREHSWHFPEWHA